MWALSLAVFLPAVGAVIVMLIPRADEELIKWVTLLATLATFGVVVGILADFDYDRRERSAVRVNKRWIEVINSRYHLGDRRDLAAAARAVGVHHACCASSTRGTTSPSRTTRRRSSRSMLILEVGMNGTFVAQDLILFFVFFEIVLLPMFFMIGVWGGPNREYASIKFFLFTLFGSALMLLSFLALYFKVDVTPTSRGAAHLRHGAALERAAAPGIMHSTQLLIFAGMFLGFAIKVPMFPFHTWLPDAHTEAPTVGSVLLAAILLKLGTYGFIRIALPMLPEAAKSWAPWIGAARRDRHHLRRARLSRADRHETADRVLVGRAHGLRDARYRDAHDVRHQRRDLRHGRARSHHRHALLHRRFGAAQLPHPRDVAGSAACSCRRRRWAGSSASA